MKNLLMIVDSGRLSIGDIQEVESMLDKKVKKVKITKINNVRISKNGQFVVDVNCKDIK